MSGRSLFDSIVFANANGSINCSGVQFTGFCALHCWKPKEMNAKKR
jgi:hypothetical protein